MPTYEYACRDCGEHLEVVQSFRDDALSVCPNCQGALRKVFSAAGIIFKGSGWHVKDYASTGKPATASSSGNGDGGGGTSTGSDSTDGADASSSSSEAASSSTDAKPAAKSTSTSASAEKQSA